MNESGTFRIESADPASPRVLNWTANKRFGNTEQTCPEGYVGDPVPAGTYYADTQEAADALAAANLVCVSNSLNPPSILGEINSFAEQSDGKIVILGSFTTISGESHPGIARLNPDGSLDSSFTARISALHGASVLVLPDDSILLGGQFTTVNGVSKSRFARLDSTGALMADTLAPNASVGSSEGIGDCFAVMPSGRIAIGGNFTTLWGGGHGRIALATSAMGEHAAFAASLPSRVCEVVADGTHILAIGKDVGAGKCIVRVDEGGSIDGAFSCSANGIWRAYGAVRRPDSKIVVFGDGITISGIGNVGHVALLNSNGTHDASFAANIADTSLTYVADVLVLPDNSCFVAGGFSTVNGASRVGLAKLNSDGSLDSLSLITSGNVYKIAYSGSNLLLCGTFSSIGGVSRSKIAKITPSGSVL